MPDTPPTKIWHQSIIRWQQSAVRGAQYWRVEFRQRRHGGPPRNNIR